jgi:hypothetical protein
MVDPGTGMVALGIALGGKDILVKMLGPTAEYLGGGLKDFAARRIENIGDIFSNASAKLGSKIDEDGGVAPKVLKGILEDGSFANDSLAIDYFGGVLASSRTGIIRDDRGAYFTSLIGRLSTYQLRTHYIFYHLMKIIFNGEDKNVDTGEERSKLSFYVSAGTYTDAMNFEGDELNQIPNILSHVMHGLSKEGLISPNFQFGPKERMNEWVPNAADEGIIVMPSALGVELFLWAYGLGSTSTHEFLNANYNFGLDDTIKISGQSMRVNLE